MVTLYSPENSGDNLRVQDVHYRSKGSSAKGDPLGKVIVAIVVAAFVAGITLAVAHNHYGAFNQLASRNFTVGKIGIIVLFTVAGSSALYWVVRECKNICTDGGTASTDSSAEVSGAVLAGPIRRGFAPGVTRSQKVLEFARATTLRMLEQSKTVVVPTLDGERLDAVWSKGTLENTVIIYHGNGCILDDMAEMGRWYRDRGMNVLMVTMRGYPGSTGNTKTIGEVGYIYDADAAVRYVMNEQRIPKDKILVHGFSLGGSLAGIAAGVYDLDVTFSNTFARAPEVGARIPELIRGQPISDGLKRYFEHVVGGAFQSGTNVVIPEDQAINGVTTITTNGLNTAERIRNPRFTKKVFVFSANEDRLMPATFAVQLIKNKDHAFVLSGQHATLFMNNREASNYYETYLQVHFSREITRD